MVFTSNTKTLTYDIMVCINQNISDIAEEIAVRMREFCIVDENFVRIWPDEESD